ncbi:MAG: hypothetical protein GX811_08225, partial [Lentisphaerae bacterium]|nr:hypothetical protein [Lentisphaerota bacterium]
MIVKMSKITILCMQSARDTALEVLRNLGVVHVKAVRRPAGDALEKSNAELARYQRALDIIPEPTDQVKSAIAENYKDIVKRGTNAATLALSSQQRKNELLDNLKKLTAEQGRIESLGDFDPATLKTLADNGIVISIYRSKTNRDPVVKEPAVVKRLTGQNKNFFFAVIGEHKPDVSWEVFRLPSMSLGEINRHIADTNAELTKIESDLLKLVEDKRFVGILKNEAAAEVEFNTARAGMGDAGAIVYLQGFSPVEALDRLRAEAAKHGWGIVAEEPAAEDSVPTLVRYPRWVKPIKALFDVIGILPGYREIDVSAVFL